MADPQKLDVYVAIVRLNEAGYARPCLIIEKPFNNRVLIAPISAAIDLYSPTHHFLLDSADPDFKETGLDRTSFVVGDDLQEVKNERLIKRIGHLKGSLADRFQTWMG